jgi:2-C-methyl-D-erythritol 4-phosphate cytidylyltransferase
MAKFTVILPAAGKSERFGGGLEKKTFAKLDGRAVFMRSIELFIGRDDIAQIILAVAPEDVAQVKTQYGANLGFMGVKLVEGGQRRVDTVRAALAVVPAESDYVAVHDAVRPCVMADWLDAVFAEAQKTGAAILASPLPGTIKRVSGAKVIEQTVPRTGLYEAQTPQVFKKDLLVDAYKKLDDAKADEITDDAQVVELMGHPVSVVISDASNLKITTKGDLTLAAAVLKSRPPKAVRKLGAFEEAQW